MAHAARYVRSLARTSGVVHQLLGAHLSPDYNALQTAIDNAGEFITNRSGLKYETVVELITREFLSPPDRDALDGYARPARTESIPEAHRAPRRPPGDEPTAEQFVDTIIADRAAILKEIDNDMFGAPPTTLSSAMFDAERREIIEAMSELERIHLVAYSDPLQNWLMALPLQYKNHRLNKLHARLIFRRQLRLPLYARPTRCPACKKCKLDVYGEHVLSCNSWGSSTKRHDAIATVLLSAMISAKVSHAEREKLMPKFFPGKVRPADLYAPVWGEGKPMAADVTCVDAMCPSRVDTLYNCTDTRTGAKDAAEVACAEKIKKYKKFFGFQYINFIPLGMTAQGYVD